MYNKELVENYIASINIGAKMGKTSWQGIDRSTFKVIAKYVLENKINVQDPDQLMDKRTFSRLKSEYKLSFPIIKFYENNYYELLNDLYPNRFKIWQVQSVNWNTTLTIDAVEWLVNEKLKIRVLDVIHLTKSDFILNGLKSLLVDNDNDVQKILTKVYPNLMKIHNCTIQKSDKEEHAGCITYTMLLDSDPKNIQDVLDFENMVYPQVRELINMNVNPILKDSLYRIAYHSTKYRRAMLKQDFANLISKVITSANESGLDIETMFIVVTLHQIGLYYEVDNYNSYSRKEFVHNKVIYKLVNEKKRDIVSQALEESRFSPKIKQTNDYSKLLVDFKKRPNIEAMIRNLLHRAELKGLKDGKEVTFVFNTLNEIFVKSDYRTIHFESSREYVEDVIEDVIRCVSNLTSVKVLVEVEKEHIKLIKKKNFSNK